MITSRSDSAVGEQDTADRPLRVALLGCGVVGSAVARLLTDHAEDLAARVGRPLEIAGIAAAKSMDCTVKALAICHSEVVDGERRISVRTHPAMIPNHHPLASVGGAYNAVVVESTNAGRLMFYGPGAGGDPTASAVMGDLVTVARHRVRGAAGPGESAYANRPVMDMGEVVTRYFISLEVADQPGVLATVAACFADHHVSVRTMRQEASHRSETADARLVLVTHAAPEAALSATVRALGELPQVHEVLSVMRVEGE